MASARIVRSVIGRLTIREPIGIAITSMRASKSHAVHGRPCLRVRLEQVPKQPLGLFQSLVRQHHGFGAPHGVRDQAFLVQSFHRSPVERFPNALTIVPTQEQEREHAVVDAVGNNAATTDTLSLAILLLKNPTTGIGGRAFARSRD